MLGPFEKGSALSAGKRVGASHNNWFWFYL